MTAPVQADADQSEISSVTNRARRRSRSIVWSKRTPSNLADYGLATPRITVAYKAAGGSEGQLHARGQDSRRRAMSTR